MPSDGQRRKRPASKKPGGPPRGPRREPPDRTAGRGWGSLARKGALSLQRDDRDGAKPPERRDNSHQRTVPSADEEWIDEGRVDEKPARGSRKQVSKRSTGTGQSPSSKSATKALFLGAVGERRAGRLGNRLEEAAEAYEFERFDDSARILSGLAKEAPDVAEVRELLGLTRYRQERWRPAIRELERYRELTGSVEQHPVLMDCYRALGRWQEADELWDELRAASPSAAIVTEGRIVAAGTLADRGRIQDAVRVLEKGWRWPKRPMEHHLRRAYVLADLYERNGEVVAAREMFRKVADVDPDLADAATRARSLS